MSRELFDQAIQHHRAGQLPEAEKLYRLVLQSEPQNHDAWFRLGLLAQDAGRSAIAVDLFRRAIALNPTESADQYNHLGMALTRQRQTQAAETAYRKALQIKPSAPVWNNLGHAFMQSGQIAEALHAFQTAVSLQPNSAMTHSNLGAAYRHLNQFDPAERAFREAITLNPHLSAAHRNLAGLLKELARLDESIEHYEHALRLCPGDPQLHSDLLYTMLFSPRIDQTKLAQAHREWNHLHAQPLQKLIQPHPNPRDPNRRLRIGYVSPNFKDHVVGRNILPLLRCHDHQKFEIICYAQVRHPDPFTVQCIQNCDLWRDIVGMSDEQVASKIREDQIDILVDLNLHMAESRLLVFAQKPAPIQVTFAGYPGTTGLNAIDYRLSDPYLDPPETDQTLYSERTLRLPDSFWCFDPLDCTDLNVNPLPASEANGITFGCLNNPCKINDDVLSLWSRVLHLTTNSRLFLLAVSDSHQKAILHQFDREGIDPTRIQFSIPQPRRDYLMLYHQIDIGLDSFPYNGHTTTLDALWMGVPIITLVGPSAVSRAGLCQLSNLNMPELIAQSPDQYVQIAAELANNRPKLQELRSTLRHRMQQSALMDAPRFARNIELAYRDMWSRWCLAQGG
ncbi:MAG TPA: tetratricopeptide repeat protein [Tepidisphaeraceae bacterium]|nr:tetratricopeptide repeat protein [Tepidisphaeraceae bacterium]